MASFASSYIPTTGSAATRNADVVSITGANFSSWYRVDEGTMFSVSSHLVSVPAVTASIFAIEADAGNTHRIIQQVFSGQPVSATVFGGVAQSALGLGGTWPSRQSRKIAYGYALNNMAASADGGTVVTDTSGTMPTPTYACIGSLVAGASSYCNGTISRLAYWPARLGNAVLQAITQ